MSGTPFTTGQLGKLQTTVNIAVTTVLPKVAKKFPDPKAVMKTLEGKGEIFASHLEASLEAAIKSMMILAPLKRIEIVISETRDPDAFFRTRKGLWVYGGFRDLVVAKAKPVAAGTKFVFDASEISQEVGATDAENESALPKQHLFDESATCAIIAEIISRQPEGQEGEITIEQLVLMYLSSCVVYFRWDPGERRWHVGAWRRGSDGWRAGSWVLAPGN